MRGPVGARAHLLPDGLGRRLVADEHRRLAGAVRHRPRGPQGARLPARRGHRAARQRRLAGQGPAGPRAPRRLPRAPGRPVDRVPRAHQGAGAARLRRGVRLAARAQADRLRPRADARRLPVRQRDVPGRRTGAPRRHHRLGDGHGGRPEARPRLGRAELARRHQRGGRRHRGLRQHVRHAVARPGRAALRRHLRPAGRRPRLLHHPRQVEARGGARAGLPARRRRREAPDVRPDRARPHAGAADLAETTDYGR